MANTNSKTPKYSPLIILAQRPPCRSCVRILCTAAIYLAADGGRICLAGVVRAREIICSGFNVNVQFNPKRIVSTGADVDPAVISKRNVSFVLRIFRRHNKEFRIVTRYMILCNPVPIFPKHFTVALHRHMRKISVLPSMQCSILPGILIRNTLCFIMDLNAALQPRIICISKQHHAALFLLSGTQWMPEGANGSTIKIMCGIYVDEIRQSSYNYRID